MLITNIQFDYIGSFDNINHQIKVANIQKLNEVITLKGFTKEEVIDLFCNKKSLKGVKSCSLSINPESKEIHIDKKDAKKISVLFLEYYYIGQDYIKSSKISLQNPIKEIIWKYSKNYNKKAIKYFSVPVTTEFWIKFRNGFQGEELTCFYWDSKKLKNMKGLDMEEVRTPNGLSNIVSTQISKDVLILEHEFSMDVVMKVYKDMLFQFIYEEDINLILEKYEEDDTHYVIYRNEEAELYDIAEYFSNKVANITPGYICYPSSSNTKFYKVYKAVNVID